MGKGERTRQSVVDHALNLVSTVGLEGLSIGHLASATGLSKSGLFAHFGSKERLQVQVIEAAAQRFIDSVVVPAIREPRGEPRVRALFERWLKWGAGSELPGGCPLVTAAVEFDDRPGAVRKALAQHQHNWMDALARAAGIAIDEGHFRRDLDTEQFAFQLQSLLLGAHYAHRLLNDPVAFERAQRAFDALVDNAH